MFSVNTSTFRPGGPSQTCFFYCLVVDLPLWKMMEFVTWDDEIPEIWKNVPNHQPDVYIYNIYMWVPIQTHARASWTILRYKLTIKVLVISNFDAYFKGQGIFNSEWNCQVFRGSGVKLDTVLLSWGHNIDGIPSNFKNQSWSLVCHVRSLQVIQTTPWLWS